MTHKTSTSPQEGSLFLFFPNSVASKRTDSNYYGFGSHFTQSCKESRKTSQNGVYMLESTLYGLPTRSILFLEESVPDEIISRTEKLLGIVIPEMAREKGLHFRRYLANWLDHKKGTLSDMVGRSSWEGEIIAARTLTKIGVLFTAWPSEDNFCLNYTALNSETLKLIRVNTNKLKGIAV